MTKARTKGEKRRGRKRVLIEREPNGRERRLSPSRQAEKVMATALSARVRQHGVKPDDAKDQKAGTWIGRMALKGQSLNGISDAQYEAAQTYQRVIMSYRAANDTPGRIRQTTGRVSLDETDYERWCRLAKARFDSMARALLEHDRANRTNSLGILDAAVMRDVDMERQIGDIRSALNAIDRWAKKGG